MRLSANSWSQLGLAPSFGGGWEIVVVAIAVGAIASASVVSFLVDTTANESDVPSVVAQAPSGTRTNLTDRVPAVPTPPAPVPVLATLSPHAQTAPGKVAAVSSPAEAAPNDAEQDSDARSRHNLRKGDRRSHGAYWSRFSERSARIGTLSRGSISSER